MSTKLAKLMATREGIQEHDIQNELIVDSYLEYLKWREFQATRNAFPPARPIHDVLAQIKASKVYEVLKRFPKGGNMHLHLNHVLSKDKMLDLIFNSSLIHELCVYTKDSPHHKKWHLGFYNIPPNGWTKVTTTTTLYSKQNLIKHITLINILSPEAKANPTDSNIRWKEMSPMFSMAGASLVLYQRYIRMHFQAMFKLEENVQYLEARSTGLGMFVLDDSVSGCHRIIDNSDGDLFLQTVSEEIHKFKTDHPEFIGYREIVQGKRYKAADVVKRSLERAVRLRQKYTDIIGGFDLVAEEDRGYSLLFYIEDFADMVAQNKTIPLYFHTSETNWPNYLMTSLHPTDPVSTLDNIYEAIILGSKRVGHGLGFIKHPYLMQVLKERNIAIEVNPVSNMLLGYVTDQRQHPAVTYIRYGIPVVLGADDPGSMGYDEFTVDWYEAFMAWGLRLSDMRKLALDSLSYSTMSSAEKVTAVQKYNLAWDKYISEMASEASSANLSSVDATVFRIYPTEGASHSTTSVRVFGRYFQAAICERIICRFGTMESTGQYVYNTMLVCDAPVNTGAQSTVDFSISLNSGKDFIVNSKLTFSYMHPLVKTDHERLTTKD